MKDLINNKSDFTISLSTEEDKNRIILAMQGSTDGLWDWNLLTNEVYYSPRWKNMLGYEEHELENHFNTWEKLVHALDRQRILNLVQEYIKNSENEFSSEMRMNHKNGSEVIVLSRGVLIKRESDGKPIRFIGTHVDITKSKKAENLIKETNTILKMIAIGKNASEVYDAIALMYEKRHPGMRCSLLELENGKLLHGGAPSMPQEYCDAVHGLKIGPNIGSCGTSTFTGKRVLVENIETDVKWKDIKKFALPHGMRCCWSEPIIDSKGNVLGAFGMYYDYPALPNNEELEDLISAARLASIVMERDHSHKLLSRNEKFISEQSKLASMGEMIGNVAHQWRQPLSIITTAASGLKLEDEYGISNPKNLANNLEEILKQANYLSQTINDFMLFIQKSEHQENLIVTDIINSALNILDATLKTNQVKVIKNFNSNSTISGLKNKLIQAFLNIITNAKDAFVLNKIDEENRYIFIDLHELNGMIIIEIKDNARGINEEIITRVFEPYFTTKHKFMGTGIGLSMVHQIITKWHNGKIEVSNKEFTYNSKSYSGACFEISLDLT